MLDDRTITFDEYSKQHEEQHKRFLQASGTAFKLALIFLASGCVAVHYEQNILAYVFLALSIFSHQNAAKNMSSYDLRDFRWSKQY